jgi:transposase
LEVDQTIFTDLLSSTKIDQLTKAELAQKYQLAVDELARVVKENYELRNLKISDEQLNFILQEQLSDLQNSLYGTSSERYKKPEEKKKEKADPKPRIKKPSERYPNIPVREELIPFSEVPMCDACGKKMTDSGMTEESEQLNVIPKKFEIIRSIRPKFRCSCHGCIKTPAVPLRIIEGSSYSDEMIIDVVASKYCDLIPIERYVQMAARGGLMDLPPQSLIELTHYFASFVNPVYERIRDEILTSRVLHADETPHKMLEGSLTKSWYLWGFSNPTLCFLDCHDTRSGDIAIDILKNSKCEVLISDVFAGYNRAIRITNFERAQNQRALIKNANCNAHARRYFFKVRGSYKEAEFYLEKYHQIYQLNSDSKGKSETEILGLRMKMKSYFEAMKAQAEKEFHSYPKGKYKTALNYFLENYVGLNVFLTDADVSIDNNAQERLLRSHVVGRKTWYGTHSERGAKTAAILFSIIETCKLNQVNPRIYFQNLVKDLLADKNPYTPKEFKDLSV